MHIEIFSTKSVASKPSSKLFTINRVEKTFRPITKNISKVLGFRAFSSSCPVSLLES